MAGRRASNWPVLADAVAFATAPAEAAAGNPESSVSPLAGPEVVVAGSFDGDAGDVAAAEAPGPSATDAAGGAEADSTFTE
jgi:hypothetical protein